MYKREDIGRGKGLPPEHWMQIRIPRFMLVQSGSNERRREGGKLI